MPKIHKNLSKVYQSLKLKNYEHSKKVSDFSKNIFLKFDQNRPISFSNG